MRHRRLKKQIAVGNECPNVSLDASEEGSIERTHTDGAHIPSSIGASFTLTAGAMMCRATNGPQLQWPETRIDVGELEKDQETGYSVPNYS